MSIKPHYDTEHATLYLGDCIEVMRDLPDASVESVVTDPPYGLEFMGREWDGADGFRRSLNAADAGRDSVFGRTSAKAPEYRTNPKMVGQISTGDEQRGAYAYGGTHSRGYADNNPNLFQQWCQLWATEALRVLKPGGHLLAFGGTRTFHRLAAGIEDAGFEIRDSIAWLYGSGFPKSLDVSKAIDRHLGNERPDRVTSLASPNAILSQVRKVDHPGQPVDAAAAAAAGWGTALKPAFEPIVVARKPLAGTVAANVLAHGTGAINIDANRIPMSAEDAAVIDTMGGFGKPGSIVNPDAPAGFRKGTPHQGAKAHTAGRWPANVILDETQAAALDEQAPNTGGAGRASGPSLRTATSASVAYGARSGWDGDPAYYGDRGGASRFFYTAKATQDERPNVDGIAHPTVKPLDLMRWLVRLVTPTGGTVLEPFAGSGTTVEAALTEGFHVIAIEREPSYMPLIEARMRRPMQGSLFDF